MLTWFLIACGTACLPMQAMSSQQQCEFVAGHYRALANSYGFRTRCIAIRRRP